MKRTIVVSGVNMIDGGALTVIKDCALCLSKDYFADSYKIVFLVHKKDLMPVCENIEYIEFPKSKSHYFYRLYYEYWLFNKLSKRYVSTILASSTITISV